MAHNTNENGAALAVRDDAPIAFGSRGELDALAKRIQAMLPSAQLQKWQKADKYIVEAEKNLRNSLYRAAQLCAFYRLVPGEDVHLIPFGNAWAVDMGIETWKKAADRYCSLHGITYHLHVIEMPADEVKARAGTDSGPNSNETGKSLYTPDDVGAIAYLWRSDKAQVYEIFGAEQAMTKGYGIWSAKARYDKLDKAWKPDNIPVQRSKMDVAERRAMKMALKREFSLDSLLAASPAELRDNTDLVEMKVRNHERRTALPAAQPRGSMDDDIDEVWTQAQAANAPQDAQDVPEEPEDGEFREVDQNPFDDDPNPAYDRLNDTGVETFGMEWPRAVSWLIGAYTAKNTPNAVRSQMLDLSDGEADDLADKMIEHRSRYQAGWKAHQAKETA